MSKLFKSFYDVLIEDIIGDTSWHGETYADETSLVNMEKIETLIFPLLHHIQDNARLPDNAKQTASGKKLQEQAESILKALKEQIL